MLPAKILLIGAREDLLESVRQILAAEGFTVTVGRLGAQARTAFAGTPPDLLFLDSTLRDTSAFELCRSFKSEPRTMHVPIVLLAEDDSDAARTAALEAGSDELLTAPLQREMLVPRVRALIRWKQLREELEAKRFAQEDAKLATLRKTFERYVSPKLVERILSGRRSGEAIMADEKARRQVVALFADMRGFTRMSETLLPLEVVGVLNEYFTALTEIAHRHEGTIFNMSGDCLLVGFGVPFSRVGAEQDAIAAACDMVTELAGLMDRWRRHFEIDVGIGIGLNKGDVIAGNIGSPSYISYTIIGDAVNVAARLMQMAQPGDIICSASVYTSGNELPAPFFAEPIESVRVKGKREPIAAYRLRRAG
ncbi:MAG TPA: adenylate/guanylate cyclase domain-containing protein [Burkholderiales bacterium]|nr:adenylate/guanylate cyclase domain-containing protein [Burkholderiales bacterium]